MNLINLKNVGAPHQEKITDLEIEIQDVKEREDFAKLGLLEANVMDNIPPIDGVKASTTRNGVEFTLEESNWSFIDVYVNDSWGRDEKTYDVRYSVGSCSGYTSNEDLSKNIAKMLTIGALPRVISQMCTILNQWKEIEQAYLEEKNALYAKKRQLSEELEMLRANANKKNEKILLERLAEGWDLTDEDGSRIRIYTGYGDNYEYVGKITLVKAATKSLTISDTRVWSDGSVHVCEPVRFKKEDILDDLYKIAIKELETEE